ncbi:MAG TPA: pyruvate, phosphate dikinase [Chloroflexota bacterium]|nr:pyruvate, phosphate dikinase [Chloroflexota bacterium]
MATTAPEKAAPQGTGTKWVWLFREGNASLRDLLGGKGAGLAEMTNAGLPVPPGLTITTEACNAYYASGRTFPAGMWEQVLEALKDVEGATGKRFGDPANSLLISVRSGAKFSMPGMMDTILNLGLNDVTVEGLAGATNNPRFAYDSYRRFIQMYGNVVLDIDKDAFEHALSAQKSKAGVQTDPELSADDLKAVIGAYKEIVQREKGQPFPSDPLEQLRGAVEAVFASWNNDRAMVYRRREKIPDDLGTAVNVQTMVFGNMGPDSGTGVAFTRNPANGARELFGDYLRNAQGEDVVAGIRTPSHISEMRDDPNLPGVYDEFVRYAQRLEAHYKDMQDLEFTIERGKLYMLQTRSGKRTGAAAVRIAVDLANEGVIDRRTAVQRVPPGDLVQLLYPVIDPHTGARPAATGIKAGPGAAIGQAVFSAERAEELGKAGEKVILVRRETSPEDLRGMIEAQGILTSTGGPTSHAAVVARGMGKSCIVGASAVVIAPDETSFSVNGQTVREGEWITLDGTSGNIYVGQVPTVEPELGDDFRTVMAWADEYRTMGVRANADVPRDARKAREFGAEGIGLCRTEHMFFDDPAKPEEERTRTVREMILADSGEARRAALERLLPFQQSDFDGIFRAMDGFPVTVRTLDPPLHEFLPREDEQIEELAQITGKTVEQVRQRIEALHEQNPMLGFRGCRLGIQYPEITEMQARAIFRAAVAVARDGVKVLPEIMIPLVSDLNELQIQEEIVRRVAEEELAGAGVEVPYLVGTMIELPRACILADQIAERAEFFSFGTNDLTQTAFGLSRDDSGRFLPMYVERKILKDDPFQVLDQEGVGQLMRLGTERGRQTRGDLKVGICGEHGGEPSSVEFCHQVGLNYVSCSPFRVPIARLAAAQAALGKDAADEG